MDWETTKDTSYGEWHGDNGATMAWWTSRGVLSYSSTVLYVATYEGEAGYFIQRGEFSKGCKDIVCGPFDTLETAQAMYLLLE